jgi:aminoglycoside phosphotransferase family enzyme/predicted kinase
MKRAVKLAYLDFSTLEKRRLVCERELELNRRTAPELYLRTLAVTRDDGGFGLGGSGEPVEWLIEMRRFDGDALLDRVAERGALDRAMVEKLTLAIERFLDSASPVKDAAWPESLADVLRTVTDALSEAEFGALGPAATIAALRSRYEVSVALLRQRRDAGYVRRCHGDMHLKNIVLIEDEPRLFDALEFDEDLAPIDVFYDLAFLLMDLWRRGLRSEANAVLNHYLATDADAAHSAGLFLLPLFMALRAGVRAMTGLDGLAITAEDRAGTLRREMRNYARLAGQLVQPPKPQLIAIGGLSGTGKTTVARAIASEIGPAPGAVHLRSDVIRKRLHGVEPHVRMGADAYSEAMNRKVYGRMIADAEAVLAAGHAVVLDATFTDTQEQGAIRALGERAGAALQAFWLEADTATMIGRVEKRKGDASDADAGIIRRQIALSKEAPGGWLRVNASASASDTAKQVLGFLSV